MGSWGVRRGDSRLCAWATWGATSNMEHTSGRLLHERRFRRPRARPPPPAVAVSASMPLLWIALYPKKSRRTYVTDGHGKTVRHRMAVPADPRLLRLLRSSAPPGPALAATVASPSDAYKDRAQIRHSIRIAGLAEVVRLRKSSAPSCCQRGLCEGRFADFPLVFNLVGCVRLLH